MASKNSGAVSAADAEFLQSNASNAVTDLHKDNLLNLQCAELLDECKLSSSTIQAAERHVVVVTAAIQQAAGNLNLKLLSAVKQPSLNTAANAHVLPSFVVTVLLPDSLWETNDYKKGRYFEKRNAIVKRVAAHLQQQSPSNNSASSVGTVQYRRIDPRRLGILVTPPVAKKKKKARFTIEIDFQMESINWIPSLRLVPNRSNLASSATSISGCDSHGDSQAAAIRYNHSLTDDARHAIMQHHTSDSGASTAPDCFLLPPNVKSACQLLQIWCLQRGFLRAHDGLTVEQISSMLLYLVRTKSANARMAPIQVCAAWFKLVATDLATNVAVIPLNGKTVNQTIAAATLANKYAQITRESPLSDHDDPPTLRALYHSLLIDHAGKPVLLDPTMVHNCLGRVSRACFWSMQRQAARSIEQRLQFQPLFMEDARFWTRHDAFLRVPLKALQVSSSVGAVVKAKNNNNSGAVGADFYESVATRLISTLTRALSDRVLAIECLSTGNGPKDLGNDSDQIPTYDSAPKNCHVHSPTGADSIVIGVTVNPDACFRVVDRGPPNESTELPAFLELWGNKAELRRFKDGAIVHAVVWDTTDAADATVRYQNDDTWQAGICERIIQHILRLHFFKNETASATLTPQFALRHVVSTVDGVACNGKASLLVNPLTAHRTAMRAFESLAELLRKKSIPTVPIAGSEEFKSQLGIPLTIDAVEPLSPALRYASLYPPVPHPLLGASAIPGQTKASGAVQWDPICIQIRFGASSKWPTDLKAIGAAKTAMLIALVNGIDSLKGNKDFDGPAVVTPLHADVCYMGYVFRIFVRADPELKLLRSLHKPSPQAVTLLEKLTCNTVVKARHHALTHGVYTSHPSSSATVRMAQRWLSTHLLSDQVPLEAVELLVCSVYTSKSSALDPPGTATAGFMRWLRLLSSHDWVQQPLIVDPQGHLSEGSGDAYNDIQSQFDKVRGKSYRNGPALYIISPCNHSHDNEDTPASDTTRAWSPTFTQLLPERVVLSRAVSLAERTHAFLCKSMIGFDDAAWPGVFQESTESFSSYSALLRIDPAFCFNVDASSTVSNTSLQVAAPKSKNEELESTFTRSMRALTEGPKELRRKLYRNLMSNEQNKEHGILLEWRPVPAMVQALREKVGTNALFLYNDLCPDVIAVVWRPHFFQPRPFSAVTSEYARPISQDWKFDTMVTLNVTDALREISSITKDVVVDVKLFDHGPTIAPSQRKRKLSDQPADDADDDDYQNNKAMGEDDSDSESSASD